MNIHYIRNVYYYSFYIYTVGNWQYTHKRSNIQIKLFFFDRIICREREIFAGRRCQWNISFGFFSLFTEKRMPVVLWKPSAQNTKWPESLQLYCYRRNFPDGLVIRNTRLNFTIERREREGCSSLSTVVIVRPQSWLPLTETRLPHTHRPFIVSIYSVLCNSSGHRN